MKLKRKKNLKIAKNGNEREERHREINYHGKNKNSE